MLAFCVFVVCLVIFGRCVLHVLCWVCCLVVVCCFLRNVVCCLLLDLLSVAASLLLAVRLFVGCLLLMFCGLYDCYKLRIVGRVCLYDWEVLMT